jgi:hypothetical protein
VAAANTRLNIALPAQGDFRVVAWALGRTFFENLRTSLKWQRLKPYEKFADSREMTSRPSAKERSEGYGRVSGLGDWRQPDPICELVLSTRSCQSRFHPAAVRDQ